MRRALLLVCWIGIAAAQTIFVVRHAERTGEPDPPLNADGARRAQALAKVLADAGVRHVYTSETVRAQQTAEPTARAASQPVHVIDAKEFDRLIQAIRATASPQQATLVVGHRATVPRIVKALGGGDIPPLGSAEHDRLLVLTLLPDRKAAVATLRY